ncbi:MULTISPECIES: AraC family transcriptional regulator [Paenibacillus]|uniref:AraC family transcriptional regulator n=1 Tax=Paenibacillus TaxID=44249 RepID=UPI0022B8AFFA|nr:AraC family transcriptional regulator [Paenibacillus caseinilyticus]MCZ8521700.1 AraC family transcriptional regulator [Paenibacillus caseinilyticus]
MRDNLREDHHEFLEIYHFTPSDYEKSGAAWPLRIGYNEAKPNYHIGPRTTPYYYLLVVLEGRGTFHQNGQSYALRPGDLFCLFPQITHEYYTVPEEPLRKIFFAFDGKGAPSLLARLGLHEEQPHSAGAADKEAVKLLRSFLDLSGRSGSPSGRRLTDLARLQYLHGIFDLLSVHTADPNVSENRSGVAWLQRGKEYLELHYADGITVERAADYVGVERTHFSKRFRQTFGLPPVQYLQELKMKEAQHLLEHTGYALSEIAHSVGYPDLFSFSKAYKKWTGLSPKAYRAERLARSGQGAAHGGTDAPEQ